MTSVGGSRIENYFSETYVEAREKFVGYARQIPGVRIISHQIQNGELKGPDEEALVIDVVVLTHAVIREKQRRNQGHDETSSDERRHEQIQDDTISEADTMPQHVLIHSSGVHGVEGYAGSAIQCEILDNWEKRLGHLLTPGNMLILIHAVDPYGMAWYRRFNENNVDLNRNFLIKPGTYEQDTAHFLQVMKAPPEEYVKIINLANPMERIGPCDCFHCQAGYYMCRFGRSRLKQTFLNGQYFYKPGMYFGGFCLEEGPQFVLRTLWRLGVRSDSQAISKFVHIDVHTGLGATGLDTMLCSYNHRRIRQIAGFAGEEKPGKNADEMRVQHVTASFAEQGLAINRVGDFPAATVLMLPRKLCGGTLSTTGGRRHSFGDVSPQAVLTEMEQSEERHTTRGARHDDSGSNSEEGGTSPSDVRAREKALCKTAYRQTSQANLNFESEFNASEMAASENMQDANGSEEKTVQAPDGNVANTSIESIHTGASKSPRNDTTVSAPGSRPENVQPIQVPPDRNHVARAQLYFGEGEGEIEALAFAQEFGTYKDKEIFRRIRAENAANRSNPILPRNTKERRQLYEAFNLKEKAWRESVLERGQDVLNRFLNYCFKDTE